MAASQGLTSAQRTQRARRAARASWAGTSAADRRARTHPARRASEIAQAERRADEYNQGYGGDGDA